MLLSDMPPWLKPEWPSNKIEQGGIVAKWEIKKRFGVPEALWWKFVRGPEIVVRWPNGWTRPDHLGVSCESADPNDHYRPWLEENVGKQGWDWNWRHSIGDSMHTPGYESDMLGHDQVVIKFRKKHQDSALVAKMLWT